MSEVKDEFDHLFGLQGAEAPAPDSAPAQTESPVVIKIPLFKPGAQVYYENQWCTVNYVTLRRGLLLVQLHEIHGAVESSRLYVEPTCLTLKRRL